MAFSRRHCPDCGRDVREPFQRTITGREVCPDCANALFRGSVAGAVIAGDGVWEARPHRIRLDS